jgi:hypothetical protein
MLKSSPLSDTLVSDVSTFKVAFLEGRSGHQHDVGSLPTSTALLLALPHDSSPLFQLYYTLALPAEIFRLRTTRISLFSSSQKVSIDSNKPKPRACPYLSTPFLTYLLFKVAGWCLMTLIILLAIIALKLTDFHKI